MRQTVFLIGAARSGTKLVRDLLAEHPAIGVVPYDVNYLWRLGNENLEDDCFPSGISSKAQRALLAEFDKVSGDHVVEKTVSNCLRIPAIAAAFPDSRYVLLLRDGFDVAESSKRQWQAPVDWRYTLRKAMTFPLLKASGYAIRYARQVLARQTEKKTATWGPRYPGIDADATNLSLAAVCARQWAACVRAACDGFDEVDIQPLIVEYEKLVTEPIHEINRIHAWLELAPVSRLTGLVRSTEIGKGRRSLASTDIESIESLINETTRTLTQWIQNK